MAEQEAPRFWAWERSEVVAAETVATTDTGLLVRRLTLRDPKGGSMQVRIAVSPELVRA